MKCERVEELLTELARGAEVEDGLRSAAEMHAAECEACAAALAAQRWLTGHLRLLAQEAEQAVERHEPSPALRAAVRSRGIAGGTASANAGRPRWWWRPAWAAAGVLVAVSAWWVAAGGPGGRDEGSTVGGSASRVPMQAEGPAVSAPGSGATPAAVPAESPRVAVARARPRKRPAAGVAATRTIHAAAADREAAAEQEIASEYLSTGRCSGRECLEGGYVLRVQLPRTALVMFGLPANQTRPEARVTADVVLGEDGGLRAVRFVH